MTDDSVRLCEAQLIDRCLAAARDDSVDARDECEANVFRLAAMVIEPKFLVESDRLRAVAARFFASHSIDPVPVSQALERGWVRDLPWLHDAVVKALKY